MKALFLKFSAWMARILPPGIKRALYRWPPLARLLRASLNRAAPKGRTNVQVAAGELTGVRLVLDLQSEKDYWLGTYETDLQQAVRALVQPGWVAYDVGANLGYISLLLARLVGPAGQVQAFEALPDNLARLRQHLQLNQLDGRVQVFAGAVIDRSGPVRFLLGPSGAMGKAEGSAGRSKSDRPGEADAIEVAGISLDDYVYQHRHRPPQVIKLDIEGGEVLALQGMTRLLREARPLLLVELHGPEAARVTWETLAAHAYRICRMQAGFPPVHSLQALDWKAYLVAFPEPVGQVAT
ncbi:MAG: FkbM family methyltransferase [Anaerolineales bacterium]|nr:FkbM family methyltransferase [Anaerolineales bacterium]